MWPWRGKGRDRRSAMNDDQSDEERVARNATKAAPSMPASQSNNAGATSVPEPASAPPEISAKNESGAMRRAKERRLMPDSIGVTSRPSIRADLRIDGVSVRSKFRR